MSTLNFQTHSSLLATRHPAIGGDPNSRLLFIILTDYSLRFGMTLVHLRPLLKKFSNPKKTI